jgi:HAE1 family hydrophobic/amphiphilic exporter-1
MSVIRLAVQRPVTTTMLVLIVVILGITSLTRLPIDLLPALEIPIAVISTNYSGVGPEEIERLITSPIEQAVATVGNIKNITSRTSEGASLVIAEFNFGTDMNFAALEIRENIDLIRRLLPADATNPMVMRIDPNALPVLQISLTGSTDLGEMQNFAEDIIKPRLERLDGVASVTVSGGFEQQVEINVNQEKLQGYAITLDQIAQILGAENLNLPGGTSRLGDANLTTRTLGEFASLEELRALPIPLRTGGIVLLGELGEVTLGEKERTSIGRMNGLPSIGVSIQKQSGTNTVRAANLINAELAQVRREFPSIQMNTVFDQSTFIKLSIGNLVENAVVGALLAMLILLLFFRNFRTTLVIGTSIPVSIIATFTLIYYNGITLNIMTLGGFALGVGMLVDNSIVVLENVYRFMEDGHSRFDAAVKGTTEVAMSVTTSTLTTVAVFLPIVFVEGLTSILFKELALTISMSLIVSLVVSLTLVPMLCGKLLVVEPVKDHSVSKTARWATIKRLFIWFDNWFQRVSVAYRRLLVLCIRNRALTIAVGLAVFAVSMASILSLGSEFIPTLDEGQFSVNITLPAGGQLHDTDEVVTEIELMLRSFPEIETVRSSIGGSSGIGMRTQTTNRAAIEVQLIARDARNRSTAEVADLVRNYVSTIPGARIGVEITSSTMLGGGLAGAPLSISLKGRDVDVLRDLGELIADVVRSVEGTREVRSNVGDAVPEIQIRVNRQQAAQYGLTAAQIASSVRTTLSGRMATRYKLDGREIDVILRGDERFQEDAGFLGQIMVPTPIGSTVPLGQVADIVVDLGPFTINRDGQARTVTITSQVFGRDIGSIASEVKARLEQIEFPLGYVYDIGGQNRELREAFSQLSIALLLAIALVYMILAAQFEALLQPFTIILTVPLSFSGGALALFLTRRPLSVPALIGAIILAGIVVNDAIVLIDYVDTRRRSGETRTEAIYNAGPIRLRPIIITTLTTVIGLIPLALGLGEGGEAMAPMATAVIGGLSLATLLTLVLIPVVYTVFDDAGQWIMAWVAGIRTPALTEGGESSEL